MALKALSVAVRCRPALPHDRDQRVCVQVSGDNEVQCLDPEHLHVEFREKHGRPDYLKENHCRERAYTFDHCFGPTASNDALFDRLVQPLVPQVMAGKHVTCFAYGQTGSGKTHTMLGRKGETGLVERTLASLLGDAPSDTNISVTFIEVYNERIRDLLRPTIPILDLREDPLRGPCIAGVCEVPAKTSDSVMQLVQVGNERRTEESTAANPVSSRSHAVLQLIVETPMPPTAKGARRARIAKLSLIDLAGSERAANTGNRGARLREGAMINRSLLALANCITALTRKGAYVNYRDSKLTRLLKDSLSGNCYTVMIAHVSPSITAFEETLNTLKYAHRACEIRGMGGGVRENVCVVAAKYADRLQSCLNATHELRRTVASLVIPGPPMPAGNATRLQVPGKGRSPAPSPSVSRAVALADALEKSRRTVLSKMRERMRIEQTVLELDDQNEANAIELSKLELDAMCQKNPTENADGNESVPSKSPGKNLEEQYAALHAATRRNDLQRAHAAKQSEIAQRVSEGAEKEHLVSLLTEAKVVVESVADGCLESVENRLLHAQHTNTVLELEKIEAEHASVMMEAATRKHQLVLQKQSMQLALHQRALAAAEAILSKHGLVNEWLETLGPLTKVLPGVRASQDQRPSVDELLAELMSPTKGMPAPTAAQMLSSIDEDPSDVDRELHTINEDFDEMRATLRCSARLAVLMAAADNKSDPDDDLPMLPVVSDGTFGSSAEDDEYSENFADLSDAMSQVEGSFGPSPRPQSVIEGGKSDEQGTTTEEMLTDKAGSSSTEQRDETGSKDVGDQSAPWAAPCLGNNIVKDPPET